MDPTANLTQLRELANDAVSDAPDAGEDLADALNDALCKLAELGELVLALDTWITKGGFLPADWQAAQDRARRINAAASL